MEKLSLWEARLKVAVLVLVALLLCYKMSDASSPNSTMANDVHWIKMWIQKGSEK